MDELKLVRRQLAARKRSIDEDVPNHAYDSALALSAVGTGLEDAINLIDQVRAERKAKRGRTFKLDQNPNPSAGEPTGTPRGRGQRDPKGS